MKAALAAVSIAIVAMIAALTNVVLAEDLSDMDIFDMAADLYESANYEEAARTYQHLVWLGYEDATLYYNLANSYYKDEDMGRAVLNYLRAGRLAPFDEDIETNLAFVRQQLDTPSSQEAVSPVLAQISEFTPWITFNQAAMATLVAWLVLGATATAYIFVRRFRRTQALGRVAAVAILCMFIFGPIAIGKYMDRQHWERIAVVTAGSADVFHGPRANQETRFSLDAGSEVRLLEKRGKWSKIGILDTGVEGWIESSRAESVLAPDG